MPDKISLGGIQTEPMLRLSKKLKPRARRTSGKSKCLKDMKKGTGFWGTAMG
jgi:hypothetical protein